MTLWWKKSLKNNYYAFHDSKSCKKRVITIPSQNKIFSKQLIF